MDRNQAPQQRELVYCHQCENEWYRDEHGIICPECQSDFTEIIEHDHDPREEVGDLPGLGGAFAPDPDEDDIGNFQWTNNGPGQPPGGHYHGTFTRNITLGGGQQGQGQGGGIGGVLSGLIGPALQGLLSGQQPRQNQQGQQGQDGQPRPSSEPGSPRQGEQQRQGGGGTFVRHGSGPGYSFTITTSSNSNLFPRDANQPQPLHDPQDHIDRMMAQMFMNIGARPMGEGGPNGPRGVFVHAGPPGGMMGGPPGGFADLLRLFGMPPGGVHGDAVYSQEALDRIITQLMEQHQTGNAPGPATEEAIDALKRRKVTAKDQGDSGKADCSICMDEAELGTDVTELPCGHWFHHDCVKAWLKEHDTCPHCRQGIMPRDEANANRPRQPSQAPMHDMHSPDYQRQNVPGEYPFPRQNSSGERRSASPRAERSSGSVFSRMREAFSPREHPPREHPPSGDGGSRPS